MCDLNFYSLVLHSERTNRSTTNHAHQCICGISFDCVFLYIYMYISLNNEATNETYREGLPGRYPDESQIFAGYVVSYVVFFRTQA